MLVVKDILQDYTKLNYPDIYDKRVLVDIILYSLIAYSYYFGDHLLYTKFIKYLLAFLLIRYLFSIITNYTVNDILVKENTKDTLVTNKNHFQLNSTIGIFVLIIFLGNFELNIITQISIILLYTLFVSAIYGYTTDNLLTIIVVYNILQINF